MELRWLRAGAARHELVWLCSLHDNAFRNGYTNNSFLEETLSLTFSHSVLGTTPATTIVSRVNSETNLGVYARVYLGHGNINNVRIQLGWGFDVNDKFNDRRADFA